MRFAGASGALLMMLYSSGALAQDNPACAKFTNDFEYNACLAKVGPKAGATHDIPPPAFDAPVGKGQAAAQGGLAVSRNKRGRMEAVFSIPPRK